MHDQAVQTIREHSKQLADAAKNLKEIIAKSPDVEGAVLDTSAKVPETDYSLSDIDLGISSLVSFVEHIEDDVQTIVVPRSLLENVGGKIIELRNQINPAIEIFTTAKDSQGGIKKIDNITYIVTANSNDIQHNVASAVRRIFGCLDAALSAWYSLRMVVKTPKLGEFSKLLFEISGRQTELGRLVETNANLGRQVEDEKKKLSGVLLQVDVERKEVNRLLQEAQSDRKTLGEYAADGTEKVATVKAVHQEATSLQGAVGEYKANFDRFDQQLKSREEKFVAENKDLESIHSQLNKDQKEVKRLISESEGMLRGATNVGLAASFSKLRRDINWELRFARLSFYLSIIFLVLLTTPIAIYVFPGLHAVLKAVTGIDTSIFAPKSVESHSSADILAQVAARALLLIPGIWLVRFTASRHERLFRLREHYAYKFSIASSVEGFKKQAPELEQGIAAVAFHELTFNPATRMDANSSESRHPNPVLEWIMKKLGGTFEEKVS